MKVFLSWSGKFSQIVAQHFSQWLPSVIQECHNPYISTETEKGAPWFETITSNLEDCDLGLVFVTPDNMQSTWLNFEAGAMLKKFNRSGVCPVLVNVKKQDYVGPMQNLQLTEINDKEDVLKLLTTVNGYCQHPLNANVLTRAFDLYWSDLVQAVEEAAESHGEPPTAERGLEDKIDEILALARQIPNLPSQVVSRERHPSVLADAAWNDEERDINHQQRNSSYQRRRMERTKKLAAFKDCHGGLYGFYAGFGLDSPSTEMGEVINYRGTPSEPKDVLVKFVDVDEPVIVKWENFRSVPF